VKKGSSFVIIASALGISLIVWKALSFMVASPVLPPPEIVLPVFIYEIGNPIFQTHFAVSGFRVIVSIAAAWIIAFPAGALIGYNPRLDRVLSPVIFLTYPVPKMVLLPVIILLFGLGNLPKIILITLILFFQILVAVRDGVRNTDPKYYDSIFSMGGGRKDVLVHAVIPAALPHSFTAIRISIGTAVSVLFFTESFATEEGLGFLIMDAWGKGDYVMIFAGITGMSLLGFMLYLFFSLLERRLCPWNYTGTQQSIKKAD